jgi:hypothetical protein
MYEYKITLNYKVDNCSCCPFRREQFVYENMESQDKISGTVSITKRLSVCTLKDKSLQYNQTVESYNSDCPLKNNIKEVK